jgi:hypothetical protein
MEWMAGDYCADHSTSLLSIAWWNIENEQGPKYTQIRAYRNSSERSRGRILILPF